MNGSRRKIFGLTCANKYNGPVKEKKERMRKKKEAKRYSLSWAKPSKIRIWLSRRASKFPKVPKKKNSLPGLPVP